MGFACLIVLLPIGLKTRTYDGANNRSCLLSFNKVNLGAGIADVIAKNNRC